MKIASIKIGLLPRVLMAIVAGMMFGQLMNESWVRLFVTFNDLFSQLLGFFIPLIIMGLVTAAISDMGRHAGRMLLLAVGIAYADTVFCGLLSYGTGRLVFPSVLGGMGTVAPNSAQALAPYFSIQIPAMVDIMSALVFSFTLGICIAYHEMPTLQNIVKEGKMVVEKSISHLLIPLLPLYIFGIFLTMSYVGQVLSIMSLFASVIVIIIVLHVFILLYQFVAAGIIAHRNPLRLLWTMFPAYLTALGTSSSAATIPVTLRQTIKNGVSESTAGFCIPLCATIHMSGSVMKITSCALAICMLEGLPMDFGLFLHFILMLCVVMVAAPGVPGGCIMAALAPLASILGFNTEQQALMITIYIAMDSFGTACNVTGDGAIALLVDKLSVKK